MIFEVLRFYQPRCFSYALRGRGFLSFTFLPAFSFRYSLRRRYLSLREERYRRKTRQRAPKPPFGFWLLYGGMRGDVRTPYEFAVMQFTRFRLVRWRAGGVRFARLRRKAKHRLFAAISLPQALLPPDSCLLHQLL